LTASVSTSSMSFSSRGTDAHAQQPGRRVQEVVNYKNMRSVDVLGRT